MSCGEREVRQAAIVTWKISFHIKPQWLEKCVSGVMMSNTMCSNRLVCIAVIVAMWAIDVMLDACILAEREVLFLLSHNSGGHILQQHSSNQPYPCGGVTL